MQSGPSLLSFFFVHCLSKHLKKKWETLTQDTFGGGSGGGCSCTSWKYLWLSASIADNRLLGSYVKSFCNNQCDKTDFHQWPNWGWIKYNYCIIKYRSQCRPKSSDDGVSCTTMFDYFSLCQHIQTDGGTHPASYSKSTTQHSLSKVARVWSWNVISIYYLAYVVELHLHSHIHIPGVVQTILLILYENMVYFHTVCKLAYLHS